MQEKEVIRGRLGGRPFLFNPSGFEEYTGANYTEITAPGASYPIVAYSGGRVTRIEFELYLNGRAIIEGRSRGDDEGADYVMRWIDHLKSFLPRQDRQFFPPPVCEFAFGPTVHYTRLESMEPIEYLMFTPDLRPLEVNIPLVLLVLGETNHVNIQAFQVRSYT